MICANPIPARAQRRTSPPAASRSSALIQGTEQLQLVTPSPPQDWLRQWRPQPSHRLSGASPAVAYGGKDQGTVENTAAHRGSLPKHSDGHQETRDRATELGQHGTNSLTMPAPLERRLSEPHPISPPDGPGCRDESI